MDVEIQALHTHETWILVLSQPDMNVICFKWVGKIKQHHDDIFECYNARLVAKGFNKQEGIDFSESFNPVVKASTICLVLSLIVSRKWLVHQFDFNNAFLHGVLDETIYIHQPS